MAGISAFYSNFLFWVYSHFETEFSQSNFIFIWLWLLCIGLHGCFPVKFPNYFIVEAPSNPLLILPFKSCIHSPEVFPVTFLSNWGAYFSDEKKKLDRSKTCLRKQSIYCISCYFCGGYSNENIWKIVKLTPHEVPYLIQNRKNNGVYNMTFHVCSLINRMLFTFTGYMVHKTMCIRKALVLGLSVFDN